MNTTVKAILITLVLLFSVVFWFTRQDKITNYPPLGTNIVAFGDSLVLGVGATAGHDFVSVVSNDIGLPIKNLGHSGDTTEDGLSRINNALSLKPDTVILLLGGNDALKKIPINTTESNLKQIIEQFQQDGAVVVLLGVRGGLLTDPYDSMYKRLAKETGSVYVENVLAGLFADSRYMSDAVHPNDAGYAIIAKKVEPVLINLYK